MHDGQRPVLRENSRVSRTGIMGGSSAYLFTSRGTPDYSGSSETEDDCSTPGRFEERSRLCPCCCRVFSKDFYLFSHLKRSKKCKILCGERGCETPIEGMHELRMCCKSRHRFHCQKCERRFKSWGGLHKHFRSEDCLRRDKYNFKGRGAVKPQVNNSELDNKIGPVSQDVPTPNIYPMDKIRAVRPVTQETCQETTSLESNYFCFLSIFDSTENEGRLEVR